MHGLICILQLSLLAKLSQISDILSPRLENPVVKMLHRPDAGMLQYAGPPLPGDTADIFGDIDENLQYCLRNLWQSLYDDYMCVGGRISVKEVDSIFKLSHGLRHRGGVGSRLGLLYEQTTASIFRACTLVRWVRDFAMQTWIGIRDADADEAICNIDAQSRLAHRIQSLLIRWGRFAETRTAMYLKVKKVRKPCLDAFLMSCVVLGYIATADLQ